LSAELTIFLANDPRAAIVFLDRAVDLDHPALQLAEVAHVFQVAGEDYDCEGAQTEVVAKIQEVSPSRARLDPARPLPVMHFL
jgi:hypothetical protein